MKKNIITLLWLCALSPTLTAQTPDPILMRIGNQEVTRSEFEYIYTKNNGETLEKQSLDEYVELFVNYKLKVAEAEACGLDTTTTFQRELAGYQSELEKPYLINKEVDQEFILEAYNRLKEEVEVSHILIMVPTTANQEQRQAALQRAGEARERVLAGEDFALVAREMSDDPSAKQNNGYLGYITGFRTIYSFETAAYNTPVGGVSEPVETQFGYHLVHVTNRRPIRGELLTAHILIAQPKDATPEVAAAKKAQIEKIYHELQAGANFALLAKEYSADTYSAEQGGNLPWFGSGRMVKPFEDAAFALQEQGEISTPFQSDFGWHIVKLLDKRGLAPLEQMTPQIKGYLTRDERGTLGEKLLVEEFKKSYNFQLAEEVEKLILRQTATHYPQSDSALWMGLKEIDTPLFTLQDTLAYTVAQFAEASAPKVYTQKSIDTQSMQGLIDSYVNSSIINYEKSQLPLKHPELAHLMGEYRDGMLLFEISNQKVWERASTDTEGLTRYFKRHKRHYRWDKPRYKGFVVECQNEAMEQAITERIESLPADSVATVILREFNTDTIPQVRIARGLFRQGDNPVVDKTIFQAEDNVYTPSEKFPHAFVVGDLLKRYPEVYSDVKGEVVADYQAYLEKNWVKELRKKYAVEIDEDVLKTVNSK